MISRQACGVAQKKFRDLEEESARLQDEVKRMNKQIDEKENELRNAVSLLAFNKYSSTWS